MQGGAPVPHGENGVRLADPNLLGIWELSGMGAQILNLEPFNMHNPQHLTIGESIDGIG